MMCPICETEAQYILDEARGCEHCTRDCTLEEVTEIVWKQQRTLKELREVLQHLREHGEALDKNWSALHAVSMDAIRDALGMPAATVPEMVECIGRYRARVCGS